MNHLNLNGCMKTDLKQKTKSARSETSPNWRTETLTWSLLVKLPYFSFRTVNLTMLKFNNNRNLQ